MIEPSPLVATQATVLLHLHDRDAQIVCATLLRRSGVLVAAATSEVEVLELAAELRPNCVLTDLRGTARRELTGKLRELCPEVQVAHAAGEAILAELCRSLPISLTLQGEVKRRDRVLIASSDVNERNRLGQQLGRAGLSVITSCDYAGSMDAVRRYEPSLLIFELALPPSGGLALIRSLQGDESAAGMKSLALVNEDSTELIERLFDSGCDDVVDRTAIPRVLLERAVRLIGWSETIRYQSRELRARVGELSFQSDRVRRRAAALISQSKQILERPARAEITDPLIDEFVDATSAIQPAELARRCGVDAQTIRNLRTGRVQTVRRATRDKMTRLLDRLSEGA